MFDSTAAISNAAVHEGVKNADLELQFLTSHSCTFSEYGPLPQCIPLS
jgi:hypothetical protein